MTAFLLGIGIATNCILVGIGGVTVYEWITDCRRDINPVPAGEAATKEAT